MNQQDNQGAIGSLVNGNNPASSESMDAKRQATIIQDFLLKLDQAKEWVCNITNTKFDITSFVEELPKGVLLAKVAQIFDPTFVRKIFEAPAKEYKHVDNIVIFFDWCKKIKLGRHFLFETIDLYESKNIPKVIYCLHGLAMFLSKRGISKGIVVNNNVKFSEEETLLFSSELKNVSIPSFDNIDSKLDSEDSDNEELPVRLRVSASPIAESDECQKIHKCFAKTLLWRKAFLNMINCSSIDVLTIRRFMNASILDDPSYQIIKDQHSEIMKKFKANNRKESEIDSLVHTIKLLHENIQNLRGVKCEPYPPANDFRSAKMILFRLIHDSELCFKILSAGFELPLRTFFPDTILGDFLFTKFIKKNLDRDSNALISVVRSHFMSSKVFHNIAEVFSTALNFDLNPTTIKHELSIQNDTSKYILVDDALNDEQVKREIVKRAQMIIDFIDSKFKFLLNVNLPYYVKIFADHPSFYENFIEPAVLASGNHTILELLSYIFAQDSQLPSSLDLERVIKEKEGISKSQSIDFSDYSPLKNYLNECKSGTRNFRDLLARHQSTIVDSNDYFIECASSDDILQVDITIEEINNIIIVLKHNLELMTPEFASKVRSMGLIKTNPSSSLKINIYSLLDEAREMAPIRVNGEVAFIDQAYSPQKYREVEIPAINLDTTNTQELSERFLLKLDNQFSNEIDRIESEKYKTVSHEFKKNLLTLILASKKSSLAEILNESDEKQDFKTENIDFNAIRRAVNDDIRNLVNSNVMIGSYQQILEDLARDYVSRKFGSLTKEISLNSETLDALFHKGVKLDLFLKNLYKYTNDVIGNMFINKSGFFFNRQTEPYSRYGTYLVPFDNFKAQVYEALETSQMSVKISCEEPMIFYISILFRQEVLSQPTPIRFDTLLKMQEEKILCIDISQICSFSIGATISVINECYVNY